MSISRVNNIHIRETDTLLSLANIYMKKIYVYRNIVYEHRRK